MQWVLGDEKVVNGCFNRAEMLLPLKEFEIGYLRKTQGIKWVQIKFSEGKKNKSYRASHVKHISRKCKI